MPKFVSCINSGGWNFYMPKGKLPDIPNCGKWMYFYKGEDGCSFAEAICRKAIEEGVCPEAKHSDYDAVGKIGSGVACFYCDGSSVEAHKKILRFFLDNRMIQKTKAEKYRNIAFKYDAQTDAGEYKNSGFTGSLHLADFVDLETGEFLR